jgi:hypothetical protein
MSFPRFTCHTRAKKRILFYSLMDRVKIICAGITAMEHRNACRSALF